MFSWCRSRLKEEYKSLAGREIAELRKSGKEVSETVYVPMFAFLGDTTSEVFNINPQLFNFPVVITECTFIHESERSNAQRTGHTLWNDLAVHVKAHPETLFVLIHFSNRYSRSEIAKHFEEVKERDGIDNVMPFLSGYMHD
eukprot:GFYU01001622.1.p1 GENE.GFYU01001622.1~~GFYU01001622.1.p1  ORF type:complete len:142 (-),score=41.96 GFYU01001622.1:204-629(-)